MNIRDLEELLGIQVANDERVIIRDTSCTSTISCETDVNYEILVVAMMIQLFLARCVPHLNISLMVS